MATRKRAHRPRGLSWRKHHWAHPYVSLALSTMTFFASSFFMKRYLDDAGIATGMTRGILVFAIPLMAAHGVAAAVDFATK